MNHVKYKVMMTKEQFHNRRSRIFVLRAWGSWWVRTRGGGGGQKCIILIYSTLIGNVLKVYNSTFPCHMKLSFILWCTCWFAYINLFKKKSVYSWWFSGDRSGPRTSWFFKKFNRQWQLNGEKFGNRCECNGSSEMMRRVTVGVT